jgi:hypothetical protein
MSPVAYRPKEDPEDHLETAYVSFVQTGRQYGCKQDRVQCLVAWDCEWSSVDVLLLSLVKKVVEVVHPSMNWFAESY